MKKVILIASAVSMLIACSAPVDKKAELDGLKKQEAEIKSKISAIEAELSAKDSVQNGTDPDERHLNHRRADLSRNRFVLPGRASGHLGRPLRLPCRFRRADQGDEAGRGSDQG